MRKRHFLFLFLGLALVGNASAQEQADKPRRAVVTLEGKLEALPRLEPADFQVEAGKQKLTPTRLYPPAELPTLIAIVLQDNLTSDFGSQLPALRDFILKQPSNTYVGVYFLAGQTIERLIHFDSNLQKVSEVLRTPRGLREAAPPSPYERLADLIDHMNKLPEARKEVLLFSEGSDAIAAQTDSPPNRNTPLLRAIRFAQEGGIPVWVIYTSALAPEVRLQEVGEVVGRPGAGPASVTSGQFDPLAQTEYSAGSVSSGISYLDFLTQSTGGKVFSPGKFAMDIRPYLDEFHRLLGQQYVLEFPGPEPPKRIKLNRKLDKVKLLAPKR